MAEPHAADQPPERVVLHVGCSLAKVHPTFQGPGWREVRLDIDRRVKPDIVASITNMRRVKTASMDAVWSSHNLEHLWPQEVPLALAEFHRVLKPGGLALITLPDLQRIAEMVAADKLEDTAYTVPAGPITPLDMIYGYRSALAQGNLYMAHHTGFTATTLGNALLRAGFARAELQREGFNLWARATK